MIRGEPPPAFLEFTAAGEGTQGVKPERMRVSSFNYGRGKVWIDRSCEVTVKVGIEMSHSVSLSRDSRLLASNVDCPAGQIHVRVGLPLLAGLRRPA